MLTVPQKPYYRITRIRSSPTCLPVYYVSKAIDKEHEKRQVLQVNNSHDYRVHTEQTFRP